jgi:predicted permease
MRRLVNRIAYALRWKRHERDLLEELEIHRQMTQERLEADGLSRRAAEAASRRALGNVALAREDARTVWAPPGLESVWQDVRYAIRTVRRQPGFALVACGALAAAIGLNTSLFTVFNALALREWPVRDAHEMVTLFNMSPRDLRARGGGGPWGFSLDEVRYFSEHAKTFAGFVVTRVGGGDKTLGDEDVPASWVSGNYFSLLGVEMALGRGFTDEEDRPDSPAAVAVLSYGYWQRQFGGDPRIAGRQIHLEEVPFTVVGVTSRAFTGTLPQPVDVWLPLGSSALLRPTDPYVRNVVLKPENCCSAVAGRLRPGVTREEAQAELGFLDAQYRGRREEGGGVVVTGTAFAADPKNSSAAAFAPMFTGTILVLLIACANVANLLIARAAVRRREIGVRLSIGASRRRVVRQLLTESLVLALASGAAGVLIALWLPARLLEWTGLPSRALQLAPDAGVLAVALAVSILASILAGLVPALHGVRVGVAAALKDPQAPSGRFPIRGVLLSVQVAVAVVLLVSAAVIGHAVRRIGAKDLGFAAQSLDVVSIEAPPRGFDTSRTRTVAAQIEQALIHSSGVALTSTPPLGSGVTKGSFTLPGAAGEEYFNSVYEVSPGYFDVLHIPIVAGRPIVGGDRGRPVIVINESMAQRFWQTAAGAIGRFVTGAGGFNRPGDLEIVGVVRDVYVTSLSSVEPTIYQPLSGRVLPQILVADTSAARDMVAKTVSRIEPRLRLRPAPLAANLGPRLRASQVAAALAGAMGGLALALAAVGTFSVFACWVQQRTHEIGVRMALGARPPQIASLVLRSSASALACGALAGILGSAGASRLLQKYLFGLSPVDPAAYVAVLLVVSGTAAAATYWPARRATRVDPVHTLRYE